MIEARLALQRPDFALDVAFEARRGITALFGPSGSGKSTVLHLIAGLVRPDRGRIVVEGEVFTDTERGIMLPAYKRHVGYIFQDALLFPHLSVRRNLGYGRLFSRRHRRLAFADVIELLGIGNLLDRAPRTLSGGERQRVAIGRALLSDPRLLLMDEPLAALDIARKTEILPYIERLRNELSIPTIYVSHDVGEVARLADRVVVLAKGRIAAKGAPAEILGPKLGGDRFARVSVLNGTHPAYDEKYGLTSVEHPAGRISLAGRLPHQHDVRIIVRATDVTLALARPNEMSVRTTLTGTVAEIETGEGPVVMATIALDGGDRLAAAITRKAVDELGLDAGDLVYCLVKAVSIDERLI
jgi:molybdate transport system ATP-binding protein